MNETNRDSIIDLMNENTRLRELLRIEHALTTKWESPWKCEESGCPYFGKPIDKACKCYGKHLNRHHAEVRAVISVT